VFENIANEGNLNVWNYLACGLPVVTVDNPVNSEILGVADVHTPRGDGTEFLDHLADLASGPGCRADLGRRGRERTGTQLFQYRAAGELLRLYSDLLSRRVPGPAGPGTRRRY